MATMKRPAWPPGYPRRRAGLAGLSGLGWVVLFVGGLLVAAILLAVWH